MSILHGCASAVPFSATTSLGWRCEQPARGSLQRHRILTFAASEAARLCAQLPLYVPNEAEKADPKLYAANVRALLLREGRFFSSDASLLDSRAYIALLRGKPPPPKSLAGQALAARAASNGSEPKQAAAPSGAKKTE